MTTAFIQTASGRHVDLLNPAPAALDIGDIAHHLSHVCRFGGACRAFYSVAEHSVRVAALLPPALRLEGLLHDAAEAYIGDVVQPLKRSLPSYQYVETLVEAAVRARFGLAPLDDEGRRAVKRADLVLLATERRDLMPASAEAWALLDGIEPLAERIGAPWSPEQARQRFLEAFETFAQLDLLAV